MNLVMGFQRLAMAVNKYDVKIPSRKQMWAPLQLRRVRYQSISQQRAILLGAVRGGNDAKQPGARPDPPAIGRENIHSHVSPCEAATNT
jgi:hypothetical protein